MLLLRRNFWHQPMGNVCKCLGMCPQVHIRAAREYGDFKGYWIVAPKNLIEVEDDADDVSNKFDFFSKQMRDDNLALKAEVLGLKSELNEMKTMLKDVKDAIS